MRRTPPAAGFAVAAALALAALTPLPAGAADETEDDAFLVPSKGEDVVRLDDGRTIRCRVGPKEGANLRLEFQDGALVVPAARVAKAFRFKDYDGTPRNDDEKAKLARGLDRWAGDWLTPTRIAELRAKHLAEEKKALADLRPARDWAARHIVEAGVFKVQSDLPRVRVREYAALLEKYMDCLKKEVQLPLTSIAPGSVSVYIHRDRKAFTKHAAQDGGVGEHTIGYFQPGQSALKPGHLVLFDMADDPDKTLDVLLHESTHFFLHAVAGSRSDRIRPWIDEGLSEYLGGSTWKYGRFQPGALQEDRLLWFHEMIERDAVVPLARLTELSEATGSKSVSEENRFGLDHYAQAWCFVHFLFHGRNAYYSGAIRDYLKSGKFTEGTAYLLTRLERKDWSVIEKQFLEYARGLKLTGGRAYGKRALIRISEDELAGASADLDAAERLAGKDLPSLVLAARAARELGQKDRAAELLRRALEQDPLDARLRLERAWCLAGEDGAKEARLAAALAPQDALIVARAGRRERSNKGSEGGDDEDDASGGMFFPGSDADRESATEISVAIKDGRLEEARRLVGTIKDRETPLAVGLVAVLDGIEKGAEAFAATLGSLREIGTPAEELGEAVGWATGVALQARKPDVLAKGLDVLYASRPPGTEPEWACWAMSHMITSNPARALEVIERGIQAHPASEQLKGLRDAFNR